MSFKDDILGALSKVLLQGILDWKMPLFRGAMYFSMPALAAIYASLQDYNTLSDIDGLVIIKATVNALIAGGTGLGAYLDSSFTRTKDRLRDADGDATVKK